MKKVFLTCILMLLFFPLISSIDVSVEKTTSGEVFIKNLNVPVTFGLDITNLIGSDEFTILAGVGSIKSPTDPIQIGSGQTVSVDVSLMPPVNAPETGFFKIPYSIRASDGSRFDQELTIKVVSLGNSFMVGANEIDPESTEIEVFIRNLENFNFENVNAEVSSPFFNFEETFDIGPKETRAFNLRLDREDFETLVAGFYTLRTDLDVDGVEATVEGTMQFVEKNIVTTTEENFGFFINTYTIEKRNEGNVVEQSEAVVKKNIISRLFTSFSPEPNNVEREGTGVYYTWVEPVAPGETFTITVKTNWLFPLLIILFVVAIVALAKQYSRSDIVLRKRVNFVKAKGGEFALKVSISVQAKRHIERVNIIDRLPALVKIYERFGGETPNRIDEKNKRLEWNFDHLEAGETRFLSYIIYSKVGVMGKFALPTATALYERNGDIHETESNQTFFVAEQRTKDLKDE